LRNPAPGGGHFLKKGKARLGGIINDGAQRHINFRHFTL
jgi:hypothetical protein